MTQSPLAEKLRVLRARKGLSLSEAAEATGVTRDTLSELERGLRHAYTPTIHKLAKGYGVPVEDLLEEPAAPLGQAQLSPDSGDIGAELGRIRIGPSARVEERRAYEEDALRRLLDQTTEDAEQLEKELKAAHTHIPGRLWSLMEYYYAGNALFGKALREGWAPEQTQESKRGFDEVWSRVDKLVGQYFKQGRDSSHRQERELFQRKWAEAHQREQQAGDNEANDTSAVDAS